jgi:predicted HTH domain antitoxin
MSARTLKIPEEIVNALRVPPDDIESELYKELALALYLRGMLSSGKASALSGLTLFSSKIFSVSVKSSGTTGKKNCKRI